MPIIFSPEDQTILEAAYTRDPKPDKAARLEIVEQVSLGEKEVQVCSLVLSRAWMYKLTIFPSRSGFRIDDKLLAGSHALCYRMR